MFKNDDKYVNAYWLYIRALYVSLSADRFPKIESCTSQLINLMSSLEKIPSLTQKRDTFVHLAKAIESLPGNPQFKAFIVGYSNILAGNYSVAENHLKPLLNKTTLYNSCTSPLVEKASQLLDTISTLQ